jgi:ribose/xylose/arabinose/galactoside ABC-type transport system permease subunit
MGGGVVTESNAAMRTRIVKNIYVVGILVLVIVIFALVSGGRFVRVPNIINILRICVPTMLIACTATLLMISGNVDLSVGGMLGLTAVLTALLAQAKVPFWAYLLLMLAFGCLMGGINGFLVTKLRITPVIATLATMSLFQGIGKWLVPKGTDMIKGNMPATMNAFAKGDLFLSLPLAVFVTAGIVIVLVVFQKRSVIGKYSVAIGGNMTAAQLSGINVNRILLFLYLLVGAASALSGVQRASYMQAGDANSAIGIELDAIIAILLGGTSFSGGSGSVLKTVAAVLILVCLTSGLTMIGMQPYWAMLIKGLVFFAALILDTLLSRKRA